MTDEEVQVREMLRARAAAITPSADGLERIEAKLAGDVQVTAAPAARRRFPVLASAAVVVVAAVIGGVVVAQRDDSTNVESGPLAGSPTTATSEVPGIAGLPLGVWPWPGDAVDESVLSDPVQTARAYVASRVLDPGATTDGGFLQGDATSGEVVFTGDVATTVFVRQGPGGGWYVNGSASDLVTLHDAGDGTTTARVEAAGELTRTTAISGSDAASGDAAQVTGGEEYPGLAYTLGRSDVALRELFVLETADGTVGITEVAFQPPTGALPNTPEVADGTGRLGVWPWPGDVAANEDVWLTDPRQTAMRYVAFRLGGDLGDTEVSDFQRGDSNSGEVVFTGDVSTTVLVRQLDGVWHVEAAITDLLELQVEDDEVSWTAAQGGDLTGNAEGDGVEPDPRGPTRFEAGSGGSTELTEASGIVRHWFTFVADDGTTGLAEVRVDHGDDVSESAIPEWAVWSEGSLDAYALALEYLEDRLPGVEHGAGDVQFSEDGYAEVPWTAGVVILRYEEGDETHWFVEQAIGDSVQIESARRTDVGVTGELRLAQAGTATITVGDRSIEVRNDVDAEGTIVPFTIERAPSDAPLRVVFRTDTGYVSLAERVVD